MTFKFFNLPVIVILKFYNFMLKNILLILKCYILYIYIYIYIYKKSIINIYFFFNNLDSFLFFFVVFCYFFKKKYIFSINAKRKK
jgi:hypothetical protein